MFLLHYAWVSISLYAWLHVRECKFDESLLLLEDQSQGKICNHPCFAQISIELITLGAKDNYHTFEVMQYFHNNKKINFRMHPFDITEKNLFLKNGRCDSINKSCFLLFIIEF